MGYFVGDVIPLEVYFIIKIFDVIYNFVKKNWSKCIGGFEKKK